VHQNPTIYGGEMTPEQFEAFEDARSETARIGEEPSRHSPTLPHRLYGVAAPMLLVSGTRDQGMPRAWIDADQKTISSAWERRSKARGSNRRASVRRSVRGWEPNA
jgi:hypothetical protein